MNDSVGIVIFQASNVPVIVWRTDLAEAQRACLYKDSVFF